MGKRAKMIKKIILGLVSLSVAVLIGFSIYQSQQLKKLDNGADSGSIAGNGSGNVVPESKGTSDTALPAVQQKERNVNDVDDLKKQLDSTEKELDSANKKLSDEISRKAELKKKEIELQKQFMKDPSYKNSMKNYLDTAYSEIFKELNLSPEKLDKLKDLIVEYQMTFSDINLDSYTASTDEEKATLKKRAEENYNENQSKLKDLLGNTDYQKYYDYNERGDARSTVNGFMDSLSTDEKLTKDQEKALIETMYKEQSKVFSEIGYDPNKSVEFISDIKAGKIDGKVKNVEKIFSRSIENVNSILTESQVEQFKKYLKEYHEQFELSYQATINQWD
jgi:hypothetical protein